MQAVTLGRGASRNGARSGVGRMGSGQPKDTSRSLGLAGGGRTIVMLFILNQTERTAAYDRPGWGDNA